MTDAVNNAGSEVAKFASQWSVLGKLSVTSWDLLIFGFLLGVTIFYTFIFVSRGRVVPILVATYMAFVLVRFAPFLTKSLAENVGLSQLFVLKLIVFAAVFLVLLYVLSRAILQSPVGAETFGIWASFAAALSQVGFLLAVLISFLPITITREFSAFSKLIFIGDNQFFFWALAPIILLLILGRKANREIS